MDERLAGGQPEPGAEGFGAEDVRRWRGRVTRSIARFAFVLALVACLAVVREELTLGAPLLSPFIAPSVLLLGWVGFAPRVSQRARVFALAVGLGGTCIAVLVRTAFWAPNALVVPIMLVSVLVVIAPSRVAWSTLAALVLAMAGVGTYYVATDALPVGELGTLLAASEMGDLRFDPRLGRSWFRVTLIFATCAAVSVAAVSFVTRRLERALEQGRRLFSELEQRSKERIHALEEHTRLEAQLRQAQRLEALGRLAGGVAHDFNNLLVVIINNAAFLKELTPKSAHRELEEIEMAGERSADLVRQLLTFSRQPREELVHLKLDVATQAALKLVRRLLPAHVELDLRLAAGDAEFSAAPTVLDQILLNLCANARDAMPKGGRISVRTARVRRPAPDADTNTDFLRLSVEDDGSGMSPEQLQKIFDPFYTTKEVGKGTGLGLSVVHGAVARQGGFIEVDSELGRGTRFDVYLPETAAARTAAPEVTPVPSAPTNETLLVVDDDVGVLRVLTKTLTLAGYNVIPCADGDEAIARYRERQNDISLVLTDSVMPKLGGKTLHEIITSSRPELPFLFCSGYTPTAFAEDFFDDERREWLAKPFRPGDVLSRVRKLLDQAPN